MHSLSAAGTLFTGGGRLLRARGAAAGRAGGLNITGLSMHSFWGLEFPQALSPIAVSQVDDDSYVRVGPLLDVLATSTSLGLHAQPSIVSTSS